MKAHSQLLKRGLDTNPITATQLLQAYARQSCLSSVACARQIFDHIPSYSRDALLWAAMISAHARSTLPIAAIHLFSDLLRLPSLPSPLSFSFSSTARAAAAFGDPLLARSLHAQVTRRHILPNIVVATSLVDMYSKCSSLGLARKVFDAMPQRNAVTWNSIIAAYASAGMDSSALELFYRVKCAERTLTADEFAISSAMSSCAALSDLRSGMQIHGYSVIVGFNMDPAVANTMAKMYFRCKEVGSAEKVLEGREITLISRIVMIKGYIFNEKYVVAVQSIRQGDGFMEVFMEDPSVVLSVLSASSSLGLLKLGKQVHGIIFTLGYYNSLNLMEIDDAILGNALIDMYSRCSSISEARLVFNNLKERNASHWNALMSGCIYNGFVSEAWCLFNEMPSKNVISWTSMISGYVQHGSPKKGLDILSRMYNGSLIRGNAFTFATALDACSELAALDTGKQIHAQVLRTSDRDSDAKLVVETALVDMYSKSGNLDYARKIFDNMQNMNVLSWTSMITGYATHGFALEAIHVFESMIRNGFVPTEVTFVSVLSACSHSGLIEQGIQFFNLMKEKYGIDPRGDHSSCFIDMLGRAGKLAEAQELLMTMDNLGTKSTEKRRTGSNNDAATWGALLGGCKQHGNLEIGSKVAKVMITRKHQASGTFVALSNFYASAGDWDAAIYIRQVCKKQGFSEMPGYSIV